MNPPINSNINSIRQSSPIAFDQYHLSIKLPPNSSLIARPSSFYTVFCGVFNQQAENINNVVNRILAVVDIYIIAI